MIIDFHNHIGKENEASQSANELLACMEKNNIDYSVVFPFNNDIVKTSLKILDLKEKKFFPFLRLNPLIDDYDTLLKENFYGIKLHPEAQKFHPNDKRLDNFYQKVIKKKLPILFHSKKSAIYSQPKNILKVAERFSKLNIVLGHFYGDDFQAMQNKLENVYSETSIFGRTLRIKQLGPDKLLFGSDSPYDDQEVELLKILKSGLKDKKKILYQNAKKLLNI